MTASSGDQPAGWLAPVAAMIEDKGRRGGFFVAMHEYRPTVVVEMARLLGASHFDFRGEVMAQRGWQAGRLPLAGLTDAITERASNSPGGLVVQNAEALLATKSRGERRNWLRAFADVDWPCPVVLPMVVFQPDLPSAGGRLHRIHPDMLPDEALLVRLARTARGAALSN